MHLRPVRRSIATCAVLAAACAGVPHGERPIEWASTVPLSPAAAAAIAAGALRHALPFADPVRSSRGAPVVQLAPDHFRIVFARGDDGAWLACATHRLTITAGEGGAGASYTVRQEPLAANQCNAEAPAATDCDLHVRSGDNGTCVSGRLPPELLPALENAFALARDPRASLPGLAEPNLRELVVHRLSLAATDQDARGARAAARELRQRAGQLGTLSSGLQQRLGDEAALTGDADGAREHWWRALAGTSDPGQRAALAARLWELPTAEARPVAWRRAARDHLRGNDSFGAMSLLHTARRQLDEPAADYRLLSQVHHQRADEMAAFASALLAREYAGAGEALAGFAAELWRSSGAAGAAADRSPAPAATKGTAPPRLVPAFATPGR